MEQCGNWEFLWSFSGIFRLLTVIFGIPSMILAWIAYFSSSWTKAFPEIVAILIVEKNGVLRLGDIPKTRSEEDSQTSEESSEQPTTEAGYDLISDTQEEYMDKILLQTLMYEKFFIGIVSIVFVISTAYLLLRTLVKHKADSPYEIMFDFIFHVAAALGLLTGAALVLLSAAKIQSFIDHISDGYTPEIVENILGDNDHVQDKTDKIAAAVLVMLNGIIYALCVVTIRMTQPVKCKMCENYWLKREYNRKQQRLQKHNRHQIPVFSVTSAATAEHPSDAIIQQVYNNSAYY